MAKKIPSTMVVDCQYGTMQFANLAEGFAFRETVCAQPWVSYEQRPRNVQQAVEMHLAYQEGGIAEVRALLRQWDMASDMAAVQRAIRYEAAARAPRDSYEYRSHYDSSFFDYRYGQ